MRNCAGLILILLLAITAAGCNTVDSRIREKSAVFAGLDAATQEKIRDGIVEPGYTPDMVWLALGRPMRIETSATAQTTTWTYLDPRYGVDDTVRSGFREHRVFDPETRTERTVFEPVDPRAVYPVPYARRFVFRNGRLESIVRVNEP